MDQFTASVSPVMVEPPKSSGSFRTILLLSVLVVLVAAGAAGYILLFGKKEAPTPAAVTTTQSADTNPFAVDNNNVTNPFVSEAQAAVSIPAFATDATSNPFDQFDTNSANTSQATSQNPF